MKKTFISTAIPYVNADPHIGFGLEIIQADVIARYRRLNKHEVYFLTGTDENSLKNVQAAKMLGVSTQSLVDTNAEKFRVLKNSLNISFDSFIRTTDKHHVTGAEKLWQECKKDIFKKTYKGKYCVGCEIFYKESELENGMCPEHKTKPDTIEEENYFFRLSSYQDQLEKIYESEKIRVFPEHRKNEVLSFIRSGLEDFSISRSVERAHGWGIPVPDDKNQIMYVWFDALANYINALGYASNESLFDLFWQSSESEKIHVIGKGVLRFHAIYWPAMLLSAGIQLPDKIFVHGYITVEGKKMSKSLGNVINPSVAVKKYGTDPIRYFLLREIPTFEDGDYSSSRLTERYNADLAHGLGNLVSRSLTVLAKQKNILVGESELEKEISNLWSEYKKHMDNLELNYALQTIWKLIKHTDRYINKKEPWRLSGQANEKQSNIVFSSMWLSLAHISHMLHPFIPETSEKILDALSIESIKTPWLKKKRVIEKRLRLFPTI